MNNDDLNPFLTMNDARKAIEILTGASISSGKSFEDLASAFESIQRTPFSDLDVARWRSPKKHSTPKYKQGKIAKANQTWLCWLAYKKKKKRWEK